MIITVIHKSTCTTALLVPLSTFLHRNAANSSVSSKDPVFPTFLPLSSYNSSSISPPLFLRSLLSTSSALFPLPFLSHPRMEERREEPQAFSVRVFTLQEEEERAEEEHMETHEEVTIGAAEGALLYTNLHNWAVTMRCM